MISEQIMKVAALYRRRFIELDISPKKFSRNYGFSLGVVDSYSHCYWMLGQMEQFLAKDKIDKAFRWLGFIQGVLWMHGLYTIDELRDHNLS